LSEEIGGQLGLVSNLPNQTDFPVQPLGSNIVIRPKQAEEKTTTGIYLPQQAQDAPQRGTVVAVGPGDLDNYGRRVAPEVEVGDTVLYSKFGHTEINHAGEEVLIVEKRNVLARLT
jgi:chaperonin GroES